MKIGITKCDSKFDRYLNWLDKYEIKYEILDYDKPNEGFSKFEECSGLILSGGVDIYPEIYCDWDTVETKGTYKPERDGFELKLFETAMNKKIPVLGICRGCQLINVYFRGSLIFDIEDIRGVNHRKISNTQDRIHKINIFKNTLLNEITDLIETDVTSSHHQSIDRLGEGLLINAKSPDGIVEGIEYADKSNGHFMIAVQWHPERFKNFDIPVSQNILLRFYDECKRYRENN
ncbi:MAG TPA: gamma-glutamyl-gamma-aminobutyrate hydrolase family protein [Ignavibacteria bacterium]|nr:gamma-glutamyl-gamma-aminobutyrate hydrolase family protein [Ignavibacteria bacterium]